VLLPEKKPGAADAMPGFCFKPLSSHAFHSNDRACDQSNVFLLVSMIAGAGLRGELFWRRLAAAADRGGGRRTAGGRGGAGAVVPRRRVGGLVVVVLMVGVGVAVFLGTAAVTLVRVSVVRDPVRPAAPPLPPLPAVVLTPPLLGKGL
jgi:hypothetical protein